MSLRQGKEHVMWTNSFSAACTDASCPRYLKARPGEQIQCEINYTHRVGGEWMCSGWCMDA